jgi:hypothetical protein
MHTGPDVHHKALHDLADLADLADVAAAAAAPAETHLLLLQLLRPLLPVGAQLAVTRARETPCRTPSTTSVSGLLYGGLVSIG